MVKKIKLSSEFSARMSVPLEIETNPTKIKRIKKMLEEIRSIDLKLCEKK